MRREAKYNLIGQKFEKLTVIERVDDIIRHSKGRVNYQVAYLCRCECGNEKIVQQGNLIAGTTKTCGDSRCRAGRATIYNTYDLSGEYGVGYTRKGEEFYFDKEDYDLIKDYHWELHKGYVACHKWSIETQSDHQVKMHRLIMGVLNNNDYRNCQIDHINHNKVDNRKENLRVK